MKARNLLILGNGGAAVHAVMAMRSAGHDGPIHLVSDANGPAFNPMLAPYYLKGIIPWGQCFPFGKDLYSRYALTCHFNARIELLDVMNKQVLLADGKRLHYDRCLVATGAGPVVPPVPGLENPARAFVLRTAHQTRHMEEALASARKVVVLGASLVGVKVAEILRRRGVEVVLMDVAGQVLPRGAHPKAAGELESYFREKGVDVRLGCSIQGMEGDPGGVSCFLPDNKLERADWVAVCTGIRPNLGFLDRSQVAVDQAILVNKTMESSASDLYAAGDVSQGVNLLTGKNEWLGLWANACYQGRTAGLNMAGQHAEYPGSIPQHVSPLFDVTFGQIGDLDRKGSNVRVVSGGSLQQGQAFLMVFEDEVLVGVNLLNADRWAGRLRGAILRRLPWGRCMPREGLNSLGEIERSLNSLDHVGRMV